MGIAANAATVAGMVIAVPMTTTPGNAAIAATVAGVTVAFPSEVAMMVGVGIDATAATVLGVIASPSAIIFVLNGLLLGGAAAQTDSDALLLPLRRHLEHHPHKVQEHKTKNNTQGDCYGCSQDSAHHRYTVAVVVTLVLAE